jgi:hypothetical protein
MDLDQDAASEAGDSVERRLEDDDLDTTEEWAASAGFPAVEVSLF